MRRARQLVEDHIEAYGMVPHPDRMKEAIATELSVLQVYASDRTHLRGELDRRTTEREYHIRMGDKLADRIREMVPALKEAERFMAYFAGETGGTFVGPGTPQGCLEQIRAAISAPEGAGRWQCGARQRHIGAEVQDCDWPVCGCDPYASKVLDAIAESGFKIVKAD